MLKNHSIQYSIQLFKNYSFKEIISKNLFIKKNNKKNHLETNGNYSFKKLLIQKQIIQKKYSFKKLDNHSFKDIIHFFEKLRLGGLRPPKP